MGTPVIPALNAEVGSSERQAGLHNEFSLGVQNSNMPLAIKHRSITI